MRSAVLVLVGVLTVSLLGCGNASTSTGQYRRGGSIPKEGSTQEHDLNDNESVADEGNPNADTSPDEPTISGTEAGQLAVTLSSATPSADLGQSVDIMVTVEPKGGFKGTADLTVAGLPEGATAAFSPAKVTLSGGAASAKLTLTNAITATPSAPGTASALVVQALAGAVKATANANYKVNPKVLLTIPMNVDALRQAGVGTKYNDAWGNPAFGAAPQVLSTQTGNGIVFQVKNLDSAPHIVHGSNGFAHGDNNNPIAPGALEGRTRTLGPGTNANGYPHDGANGPSVSFQIKITAAE